MNQQALFKGDMLAMGVHTVRSHTPDTTLEAQGSLGLIKQLDLKFCGFNAYFG